MILRYSIYILLFLLILSCKEQVASESTATVSGMVLIHGGFLHMGGDSEQADQNEFPKHKVKIASFWMDQYEVTNAEFKSFTDATGYVTLAERPVVWEEMQKQLPPNTPRLHDSLLAPGSLVFNPTNQPVPLNNPQLWWKWVIGANWRHPRGPNSGIEDIMDHPVVQISWEDAAAYCKWANKRLPTEAEWEWAARGGQEDMIYPWGNESLEKGLPKANYYQGVFPVDNTLKDGYETTAPKGSFAPNGYGLYDMAGNVWEWCQDWYDVDYYSSDQAIIPQNKGPRAGNTPNMPYQQERVIRGGSFLCNESYCSGYRNSRRMGSTPDTGLNHTGFRCVMDTKE